jgi:L-amino acid N-acyltransferase YncA
VTADVTIRAMRADDWPVVRCIYEAGIATGHAAFETSAPTWQHWDHTHVADHRLIAVADGEVVGWAALSTVSDRCVCGGVAENSIYVHTDHRNRGVGRTLLVALIASSEAAGIRAVQTGIFPENAASVALHQRVGFRIVGHRERIGKLDGMARHVASRATKRDGRLSRRATARFTLPWLRWKHQRGECREHSCEDRCVGGASRGIYNNSRQDRPGCARRT